MAAAADPLRAPGMQAYMKSTMPYYGLKSAQVDEICQKVFAEHPFPSCREWSAAILRALARRSLPRGALCIDPPHLCKGAARMLDPGLMPVLEEMIVTGAWWDYVDAVAHVVGELLRSHPEADATRDARVEHRTRTSGSAAFRSSARTRSSATRTSSFSTRTSSRTWRTATSSSARRSAGRCGLTRGRTPRRSRATCEPTRRN